VTAVHDVVLGNGVMLAPLAGITEPVVRLLCRLFGAGPLMTEMVSAHGIARGAGKPLKEQMLFPGLEQPLAVQLVGSEPEAIVKAGLRAAAAGASSINLNMACPARKIIRNGKGVALMRTPDLARQIMEAARAALPVPVTIKIRSGWDADCINAVELARIAEQSGMAAVIVHPRTRPQGFSGKADWSVIADVRRAVSIPVIGNGDIHSGQDAVRMLETTGCHGVMVGRAALGRPWLFAEILEATGRTPAAPVLDAATPEISDLLRSTPLDWRKLAAADRVETGRLLRLQTALGALVKRQYIVVREMRKHLIWCSRGMAGAHPFRTRTGEAVDYPTLYALIDEFFQ
jgi:nifR3 family TIM-barrel protein